MVAKKVSIENASSVEEQRYAGVGSKLRAPRLRTWQPDVKVRLLRGRKWVESGDAAENNNESVVLQIDLMKSQTS
jgi:hypothetical protein